MVYAPARTTYLFKGRLCGLICPECPEPLLGGKVRLYRTRADQNVLALAVADPKDTFAILTDEMVEAKAKSLIAEVETDAEGNFAFELGANQSYSGEAFEIDFECGTVYPHKPLPRPHKPVQFSITTLQPQWRQTKAESATQPAQLLAYSWDYCIPSRFWCAIRARFGAWTICGEVLDCRTKTPIPNVRVRAFDTDIFQDDSLGSAVTDSAGHFRIDYTAADFQKTPLSPAINFEIFSGPDLYFRVETLSGNPLLVEDRTRGRQADRGNVSPCFCVDLCIDPDQVPPDNEPDTILSVFYKVGGYNFLTQIDSSPSGTGLTLGDNRAFYSTLRLNGAMGKKLNGQPAEYLFEVAEYGPGGVLGAWQKVTPAQIARTDIGTLERYAPAFPGDLNPIKVQAYTVNGTAGPDEVVTTFTADGWLKIPQENNVFAASGAFSPNGNFINFMTNSLLPAFGSVDLTGLKAGDSATSTGKPLVQNRYFAIRMWVREAGNLASRAIAGTCERIAINNTLYDNLKHHPTWATYTESGVLGVALLDIQQLVSAGCQKITDQLDVLYTAAHPNLGSVQIYMKGPGGTYSFSLASPVTPDTHGTAIPAGFVVADLPSCAYVVHLVVSLLLTTGDSVPLPLDDEIAFCK